MSIGETDADLLLKMQPGGRGTGPPRRVQKLTVPWAWLSWLTSPQSRVGFNSPVQAGVRQHCSFWEETAPCLWAPKEAPKECVTELCSLIVFVSFHNTIVLFCLWENGSREYNLLENHTADSWWASSQTLAHLQHTTVSQALPLSRLHAHLKPKISCKQPVVLIDSKSPCSTPPNTRALQRSALLCLQCEEFEDHWFLSLPEAPSGSEPEPSAPWMTRSVKSWETFHE